MQFDESKHKRDKDGKFTNKNGSGKSEEERLTELVKKYSSYPDDVKKLELCSNYSTGSGALNLDRDEDYKRAVKHAELYYLEIMHRSGDVSKISRLLNISKEKIEEIKQYVFNNKVDRFFPDYDQAQSWQRLSEGKPLEHDIIFIKHELLEIEIRNKNPEMPYSEAHDLANEKYNYQKALDEWKEKENGNNKKKRSNKG